LGNKEAQPAQKDRHVITHDGSLRTASGLGTDFLC